MRSTNTSLISNIISCLKSEILNLKFQISDLKSRPFSIVRVLISFSILHFPFSIASGAEPVFPPALKTGDTIAIIAPAGPVEKKLELAIKRLREMGYTVKVAEDIYRKTGYLAGSDQRRATELMDAFRDPDVDMIMPARGGYGTMRILELLDYEFIRTHPKIFTGFSDNTALHLAMFKKAGLVSFHSPVPTWGLGDEENMRPLTAHWFWRAIHRDQYAMPGRPIGNGYTISTSWPAAAVGKMASAADYTSSCDLDPPEALHGGTGRGRLVGGNLSLIAALAGTEYEMETDGRILMLEDVGEAPYKVDRMLRTLQLAGRLDKLAGVVCGTFTRRKDEDTTSEETTIKQVLTEYFANRDIPVIYNFPVGHHECNVTLPHGALYEINADRCELKLLENPVVLR